MPRLLRMMRRSGSGTDGTALDGVDVDILLLKNARCPGWRADTTQRAGQSDDGLAQATPS
jgi:hypothetical protein